MKIGPRDMKPLVEKRTKAKPTEDPNSIEARCRREGVKTHPSTIRSRMRRHDLSFEEAIAYRPVSQNEAGRRAKKHSLWGKDVPQNSEEYKLRQGRKPSPREE